LLRQWLDAQLGLTKALSNYLMFNAHQAAVANYGNFTALKTLYYEISQSFAALQKLHRESEFRGDESVMRRVFANMKRLHSVIRRMNAIHSNRKTRDPLWRTVLVAMHVLGPAKLSGPEETVRQRLISLEQLASEILSEERRWISEGHHPIQIERVYRELVDVPRVSWPKGIHKTVANRLGISNSVASLCVDDLLVANRLGQPLEITKRERIRPQPIGWLGWLRILGLGR
jgi:hypothetical protein